MLLCPWGFPGKSTGVDCHFLLQGKQSETSLKEEQQQPPHNLHWSLLPCSSGLGHFCVILKPQNSSLWVLKRSKRNLPSVQFSSVAQSCPTLCDPMDCSLPCSSVHGIFQAIILEWIAISFSRGSSRPRDRTQVSCIVDRRFTIWATREVHKIT